jgi:hypothetical protein
MMIYNHTLTFGVSKLIHFTRKQSLNKKTIEPINFSAKLIGGRAMKKPIPA